jgi:SAM-dependent methyltransferase
MKIKELTQKLAETENSLRADSNANLEKLGNELRKEIETFKTEFKVLLEKNIAILRTVINDSSNETKKYFNEVKRKRYFIEPHIKEFAKFKNYNKKNVLEIGCGIGTDAIEFIKNGAKYFGIEYSEKSLEITKKRIEVLNLKSKNPKLFNLDCENLSKIKKLNIKFHLIYSFGVIHHTPNPNVVFEEIKKYMNIMM